MLLTTTISQLVRVLATIVILQSVCLSAEEMRVWQSLKGTKTTAKIVSIGEKSVVLMTAEGKKMTVLFKQLIKEDVEYLEGLNKSEEEGEDKPETKVEAKPVPEVSPGTSSDNKVNPALLPILKEGAGRGSHAYYEGKRYIAKVTRNGGMIITIKDDKGEIIEGWHIVARALSYNVTPAKHIRYPDEKLLEHKEPQANAKTVTYKMLREKGITCEVNYEFNPDGFSTWFSIIETEATPKEVYHQLNYHLSTFENLSKEESYFEKMKMKRKMVVGGRSKLDFTELIKPAGNAEEHEFSGALWGKLKITVEKGRSENTMLTATTYPGMPMKNGINLYGGKEDYTKNNPDKEKVTFIFK